MPPSLGFKPGCGLEPNQYRDVIGAALSRDLGWDFVNAGAKGFSNSWAFSNFEYMIDWLNASNYTQGVIHIALTENGRDIESYSVRPFDYLSAYKHLTPAATLYDQVLTDIEDEWIERLKRSREKLDSRFIVVIGNTVCWHERMFINCQGIPGVYFIDKIWLEVLADAVPKSRPPRTNTLTIVECVDRVNDILGIKDRTEYMKWFMPKSELSIKIVDWMASTPEFFESHNLGHPNARGHQLWADEIKKIVDARFN